MDNTGDLQVGDERIVGHSDPKTTAGYDRRPEAAKRKAAGFPHLPYRRRVRRDR